MEKLLLAVAFLTSFSLSQGLQCDWVTENGRRLIPYISGPIFTVPDVADLVSCQRECVESTSFICAAVSYSSVSRICELLEENDQTATPASALSWQYSLRPICAGMWQPWTARKGKYLDTGVTKFDRQNTEDLRSCMTRCIEDNVNTTAGDYRCRSVIKSIASPGVCYLVDKRSDDAGIVSEANTTYQYFDRPHWYTDSAPGTTNSDIVEYFPRGTAPTIFTGQKIESDGYIVAWQYYLGQTNNYCDSYAGVWRQEGDTNTYTLIMETLLSPIDTSSRGVRFQYTTDTAVRVKKDDVISTHVRNISQNGCSGTLVAFESQRGGTSRYGEPSDIAGVGVGDSWATSYSENRQAALRPFIAEYLDVSSISVSYGDSVNANQVKLSWGEPAGLSNQSIAGGGYQIECFESHSWAKMGCTSEFVEASGEKNIILQLESTHKVYNARIQIVRNVNGQKAVDASHRNSTEFCAKRGMLQSGEVNINETGLLEPGEKRTVHVEIPSLKDNSDQCLISVTINNRYTGRTAQHRFVINQGEDFPISVRVDITGGLSQVVWAGNHRTKQVEYPPVPPTTTADSRTGGMSSLVTPIVGSAVGVIIITIFVIGGVVMYRRKSRSNDSGEYNDVMTTNNGNHTQGPQTPATERALLSSLQALEESHAYEEMASSVQGFHDIPISRLHYTILEEKRNNPSTTFKEEFLKIRSPKEPCKIGRLAKNVMKNRLRNVTANDESRVVLSLHGYQTDYINANYIKDSTGSPGFIAAQGPTDESLEDMWRMVNDTKTNAIVMLTNLFEAGKEKCSVYWPESATEKKYIGQFTIQLVDEQRCAEYVVRKLKYEFNKTSRNVMHYQFTEWSDKYLPTTLGLLNFRNRVNKDIKSHRGMTIIHCSEGCGRTGAYIALDLLIDEAHDMKRAKHQTVNVMKCVYDLRLQRTQMVQTANQYAFLYDLLSEALECRDTAVDCSQFPQQLINWRQTRKGNHTTLKEHFKKVVASRSASSETPNDARLYENTNDSVPPLSRSGEGLMRGFTTPSDNVNAVYVDLYVKRCGFIATQAPPEKIKGYYWRMIMETKCPVIVYFNGSQGAEEYWPRIANAETTYADVHVKCLSSNQITDCSSDSSMSTECELVCRTPETTQEIKHIEVKVGSNLPTAAQLLSLCTRLEKFAMSRSSTITVQCSDGSRLTGLLIVALNIYLRMMLDQEVDVVMEVKLARRSCPQFIPDFETFDLLYDFVSTYLSQHNDYQSLLERRGSENDVQSYASLHHYSN